MKEAVSGVVVIDKPVGPTSHDIVATVRKKLHTKVGHAGTLDPLASGVLPLMLGRATRLMRFYQKTDKVYRAEIQLGKATDTFDREGKVVSEAPVPVLSSAQIESVLDRFRGEIEQLPPMFSAVKVDGERLYQAARRGETRLRQPRRQFIAQLELLHWSSHLWSLRVSCSSGTYIRALAQDIGQAIGCGAHLVALRRLQSGPFDLLQALPFDQMDQRWEEKLLPLEALLPQFPRLDLNQKAAALAGNGNPFAAAAVSAPGFYRLFFRKRLVAIGRLQSVDVIQPVIVLAPAG